jgi:DNA-binding NarL/FixJ family response regulator
MENGKIINLFIVEDNVVYATALRQFLLTNFEKYEYRVLVQAFKNAENALEYLSCENSMAPHIIILDYLLNSQYSDAMNGLNALFQLKHFNHEGEIIYLSGQKKMEVTVQLLRVGAFDYIIKDENAFNKVLQSVLECIRKMEMEGKLNPGFKSKSASL